MCELKGREESLAILDKEFVQNGENYLRFSFSKKREWVPVSHEDVLQDIYVKLKMDVTYGRYSFHEYEPLQIRKFIIRAILQAWCDLHKKYCERHKPMESLPPVDLATESNEPAPWKGAEDAEVSRAVQDCMSRLSKHKRELITLKFFEDLSHAEIGAILEIAKDLVSGRVRTALTQLRKCLESKQSR